MGMYTYNGILMVIKINEILIPGKKLVNFENIMLSEGNQTQKAIYYMIPKKSYHII